MCEMCKYLYGDENFAENIYKELEEEEEEKE